MTVLPSPVHPAAVHTAAVRTDLQDRYVGKLNAAVAADDAARVRELTDVHAREVGGDPGTPRPAGSLRARLTALLRAADEHTLRAGDPPAPYRGRWAERPTRA